MARKNGGPPIPIYHRNGRFYLDARKYGKGRVALKPAGAGRATTNEAVALKLAGDLMEQYERQQRGEHIAGPVTVEFTLKDAISAALVNKAREGRTATWIGVAEMMLHRAMEHFGSGRALRSISTGDVKAFADVLLRMDNGRGSTLSTGSVRHHLNALSSVFTVAAEDGNLPAGSINPVVAWKRKPTGETGITEWLEMPEATLLLEAARLWKPKRADSSNGFAYPLLATYLLTGMRESEATGLLVEDVQLDRGVIQIRDNRFRRLKTKRSRRTVPIWPQLLPILRAAVAEVRDRPPASLLFPSARTGKMIADLRKSFDAIADLAGLPHSAARTRTTRVTYTAARLQTTDRGEAVSAFTVARELGHSSTKMIEDVYGRLGEIRHRADVVEYSATPLLATLETHNGIDAAERFRKRLLELADRANVRAA